MLSRKSIGQRALFRTNSREQILSSKNLRTRFTYLKTSSGPALRRCTPKSGKNSNERRYQSFARIQSIAGRDFCLCHSQRTAARPAGAKSSECLLGPARDIAHSRQSLHVGRRRREHCFVCWTRRRFGRRYWNTSEFGSRACSNRTVTETTRHERPGALDVRCSDSLQPSKDDQSARTIE